VKWKEFLNGPSGPRVSTDWTGCGPTLKFTGALDTKRSTHGLDLFTELTSKAQKTRLTRKQKLALTKKEFAMRSRVPLNTSDFWASLIYLEKHQSEVVPIAENGCKVRVVTKSTKETVHTGHSWRDRMWQYLLTHPWTRGPITK